MTTLHHKGRTLRVTGTLDYIDFDDCPYPGREYLLGEMRVEDADTGEDLTDEFGDDQEVINASWEAAEETENWRQYGSEE